MRCFSVILAVLCVSGCTTSVTQAKATPWIGNIIDRSDTDGKKLNSDKSPSNSESDIEKILSKKVELKFPVKLAVVRVDSQMYHSHDVIQGEITEWNRLKGLHDVDRVIVLPAIANEERGSKVVVDRARKMAAQAQADLVFLYQVGNDSSVYLTPVICVLDLTIVGGLIFPGRTVDSLSIAQGILLDVKSGVILAAVEGNERKTTGVAALTADQNRTLFNEETKIKAVQKIASQLEYTLIEESKRRK